MLFTQSAQRADASSLANDQFISVPEGRSARYDSSVTPVPIYGLYTDDISTCKVIILFKKQGAHIKASMIHANELIEAEQVSVEKEWIGDGCQCLIFARSSSDERSIIRRLQSLLPRGYQSQYFSAQDKFGISFDRNLSVKEYTRENLPTLAVHPQEWLFHSTYKLNITCKICQQLSRHDDLGPLQIQTLIFDAQAWQPLRLHDQSLTLNFILDLQAQLLAANAQNLAHCDLIALISRKINERILVDIPSFLHDHDIITLAINFERLWHQNNFLTIFVRQVDAFLGEASNDRDRQFLNLVKNVAQRDYANVTRLFNSDAAQQYSDISRLRGIYKICLRMQKHTAQLQNEVVAMQYARPTL